uniref:thioredoxin domain-containing protein n=1 Tax=Enterocloster asparagiformis TaxID=333367 RepID=UPI003323B985
NDRKRLLNMSHQILAVLRRTPDASSPADPEALARRGYEELRAAFDKAYGGFGRAPKFPAAHNLLFLMRYRAWADEPQALAMAEKTLSSMARGGIHDHLGGGFSRYSTDQMWLVPHFEKMLYDNALLALAYLEGYRLTGNRFYQRTARQILDYVRRELTGPEGGFYCGQDADSQGVEGKYYVFSEEEIGRVLGSRKDQEKFCRRYGITKEGNFEGANIPNLIHNPDYEQRDLEMDALCRRLYEYRLKRLPLHRDDKILASWNALMIIACARAGFLLDDPGYLEMAGRAQMFVEQKLFDENGRLLVRYRQGESAFPGNLDDYAFYCLALLTLYEVTLDASYLELAVNRAEQMVELFWDEERGGFYFYGSDVPELIDRPKELYDGAMPSGNSAAAHVLASLADLTANRDWRSFADRQLDFLAAGIADFPSAHSFSLTALMDAGEPGSQLVCVSAQNEVPGELYAYRREPEHGRMSILFKCPDNEARLSRLAPFTREYPVPDLGTCYYLCQNHTCGLPFTSLSEGMPGPRDLNGKENA